MALLRTVAQSSDGNKCLPCLPPPVYIPSALTILPYMVRASRKVTPLQTNGPPKLLCLIIADGHRGSPYCPTYSISIDHPTCPLPPPTPEKVERPYCFRINEPPFPQSNQIELSLYTAGPPYWQLCRPFHLLLLHRKSERNYNPKIDRH